MMLKSIYMMNVVYVYKKMLKHIIFVKIAILSDYVEIV